MQDPMAKFEIPAEMRKLAEDSVEQAKRAFDGFVTATHRAVGELEDKTRSAQAGARDMGQKAMTFAERNVAASFDLAQKLVRAKDAQEMMRLQAEYVAAQMQILAEQAKELGASASRAAMELTQPKR